MSSAVGSYHILHLGVGETFPYPGWEFSAQIALFSVAVKCPDAVSTSVEMRLPYLVYIP